MTAIKQEYILERRCYNLLKLKKIKNKKNLKNKRLMLIRIYSLLRPESFPRVDHSR